MRKRFLLLILSAVCCFSLNARILYLDTGGSSLWETGGAQFAVWHWQGSNSGSWSALMTNVSGSVWQTTINDASDHVIFVRLNNTATAPDWTAKWNQTEDLTVSDDYDLYIITGWGEEDGNWSQYGAQPTTPPVTPSDYSTAAPMQCEDVMLQAFYWGSNLDGGYGDTKWATLSGQASEIGQSFDLVWLPPSAAANNGGMGYIPNCYSNQGSTLFGKRAYLESLISAMHSAGVKVIADIVINHCGNRSNACDYSPLDFGTYGSFSPQSSWMTSNDEGVSSYGCSGGSNADDGQHDANYGPARDWDHKNTQVQAMCKAYLQWMKNVMLYDGFRYDYCGGYHVSHVGDYNTAAKPYFSVMEYWVGDANELKTRIDEAGKNTLTFDFANMYTALRDGIASSNYSNCLNAGLRGKGYSRYAVTFIDNHDTFNRGSDNSDVCGNRDGSSINNSSVMLQCNAYILSLPGVPCVFYPHWVRYKSEIQSMIYARKAAGIHSESTMQEEAGSGYYRATIQGKHGSLKLMLGSAANDATPSGYTLATKGSTYAVYYISTNDAVPSTNSAHPALDTDKPMFNLLGQPVTADYHGIVIQNGHKHLR